MYNIKNLENYLYDLGFYQIFGKIVQNLKYFIAQFLVITVMLISTQGWAQNPTPVKSFRDCPDCPEMVPIPAGTFEMGVSASDVERLRNFISPLLNHEPFSGQPQHKVTIAHRLAIGKYPVTLREFAKFVQDTGFSGRSPCTIRIGRYFGPTSTANWSQPGFVQKDNEPVVCVSWLDAKAYVDWLNTKTRSTGPVGDRGQYRLPTEAEYEYAARAGTTTTRSWGDDIGTAKAHCKGCGVLLDDSKPAPVGTYAPNPFGLYDMLGNVWEWTQDCWSNSYEKASADGSSWRDSDCRYRVVRGGSWVTAFPLVTAAGRLKQEEQGGAYDIGFRVVRSIE